MKMARVQYFLGTFVLLFSGAALADAPAVPAGTAPANGAAQQPGPGSMLIPMAAMFAVVYFLMIRPQQKRMKEQQAMLNELKQGDDVVTASGMLGKVTGITDKVVTLEVDQGVHIKMLKSQITQVLKGGQVKDLA